MENQRPNKSTALSLCCERLLVVLLACQFLCLLVPHSNVPLGTMLLHYKFRRAMSSCV